MEKKNRYFLRAKKKTLIVRLALPIGVVQDCFCCLQNFLERNIFAEDALRKISVRRILRDLPRIITRSAKYCIQKQP